MNKEQIWHKIKMTIPLLFFRNKRDGRRKKQDTWAFPFKYSSMLGYWPTCLGFFFSNVFYFIIRLNINSRKNFIELY
jgi:hypothetical protein